MCNARMSLVIETGLMAVGRSADKVLCRRPVCCCTVHSKALQNTARPCIISTSASCNRGQQAHQVVRGVASGAAEPLSQRPAMCVRLGHRRTCSYRKRGALPKTVRAHWVMSVFCNVYDSVVHRWRGECASFGCRVFCVLACQKHSPSQCSPVLRPSAVQHSARAGGCPVEKTQEAGEGPQALGTASVHNGDADLHGRLPKRLQALQWRGLPRAVKMCVQNRDVELRDATLCRCVGTRPLSASVCFTGALCGVCSRAACSKEASLGLPPGPPNQDSHRRTGVASH